MPLVFTRIILVSSCLTIINQCSWLYLGDTIEQFIRNWLLPSTNRAIALFSIKEEKVPFCLQYTGSLPCYLWLTLVKSTNALVLCCRVSIWGKRWTLNLYAGGMDGAKLLYSNSLLFWGRDIVDITVLCQKCPSLALWLENFPP